ncbi:uncharacterized protein EV420DRAFT_1042849 [Desarmillaria tabescens]|uniref:DUF6533 domain-containing protein n=1 Tax=Armillaria tabescens TaxID=1929756 RepID=A0AA39U0C7_ARMTA|nr:uncharacterized protein EV420DRAFT_1042849 [Desarmillaria tabescens]KAK0464430.1 hypothetical protein EV420DRAFT_1042849 [Desarmillaria tabescens]
MPNGPTPFTYEEVLTVLNAVQVGRRVIVAVYVLQVYEWLICWRDEVELIWSSSWNSMRILFTICRYFPLLFYPFYLWAWIPSHSKELCEKLICPLYGFCSVFQLSAQAVILIRSYAFSGQYLCILILLCTCWIGLAGADIWMFFTQFILVDLTFSISGSRSSCFGNDRHSEASYDSGLFATPVGTVMLISFGFDTLMMVLCIVHCLRTRSAQGPLGRAFLKQGIAAFLVISSLNFFTAMSFFGRSSLTGITLPLTLVMSDIIACRLQVLSLSFTNKPH